MGMEYFIRFMTKQGRAPLANGKELSECNLWYQAKLCDQTRGLIADLSNPQYQARPVVFTSEQRAYAFDQLRVLLSEFMEKTDCVSEVLYDDVRKAQQLAKAWRPNARAETQ